MPLPAPQAQAAATTLGDDDERELLEGSRFLASSNPRQYTLVLAGVTFRAVFNFNVYSSLLLPGFLQGVVFAVLLGLRARREARWADVFAALVLLIGALYVAQWMLGFGGWYDERDGRTTVMFYLPWEHLAALGPLVWLYFRAVTNTDFRWRGRYWRHFLPYGGFLLLPLLMVLHDFGYERLLRGESFAYFGATRGTLAEWTHGPGSWLVEVIRLASRLLVIGYLLRTIREFADYRRYLEQEFSNADRLWLPGLRALLWLLLLGIGGNFMLEIAQHLFGAFSYVDSWNRYFVMSLFVFAAAIQFFAISPHLTRPLRFESPPVGAPPVVASVAVPPAPVSAEPHWAARLEKHLDAHPDYLDPNLKLGELATRLGTNSSVLSRAINQGFGKNFNDFVNGYRCSAFRERVAAGAHERHTLLSLALDCGFNSKSTFNRAFRKQYGRSPGAMIREWGANHDLGRVEP